MWLKRKKKKYRCNPELISSYQRYLDNGENGRSGLAKMRIQHADVPFFIEIADLIDTLEALHPEELICYDGLAENPPHYFHKGKTIVLH